MSPEDARKPVLLIQNWIPEDWLFSKKPPKNSTEDCKSENSHSFSIISSEYISDTASLIKLRKRPVSDVKRSNSSPSKLQKEHPENQKYSIKYSKSILSLSNVFLRFQAKPHSEVVQFSPNSFLFLRIKTPSKKCSRKSSLF